MIIVMAPWAVPEHIQGVVGKVSSLGREHHVLSGDARTLVIITGEEHSSEQQLFETMPGVERLICVAGSFKLASRDFRTQNTRVVVGSIPGTKQEVVFGGREANLIAGPCAIESEEIAMDIAHRVKACGCRLFRGGAFKPRTSPYSFQGLGHDGLRILEKIRQEVGLLIVTEVIESSDVDDVAAVADVLQIGMRNMTNYRLLQAVGKLRKPVLLKRGMSATINEFLMAAEYILSNGNPNVILCERGIRTFESHTRFTLDINAVAAIKQLSHLPIIVDPSHATGNWRLVEAASCAGIAAGADGLLMEVHIDPQRALSDGAQALLVEKLPGLLVKLDGIARVLDRTFA